MVIFYRIYILYYIILSLSVYVLGRINKNRKESKGSFFTMDNDDSKNNDDKTLPLFSMEGEKYENYEINVSVGKEQKIIVEGIPGTGYSWYLINVTDKKPNKHDEDLSTTKFNASNIPEDFENENLKINQPTEKIEKHENKIVQKSIGGAEPYEINITAKTSGTFFAIFAYTRLFEPAEVRTVYYRIVQINAE